MDSKPEDILIRATSTGILPFIRADLARTTLQALFPATCLWLVGPIYGLTDRTPWDSPNKLTGSATFKGEKG